MADAKWTTSKWLSGYLSEAKNEFSAYGHKQFDYIRQLFSNFSTVKEVNDQRKWTLPTSFSDSHKLLRKPLLNTIMTPVALVKWIGQDLYRKVVQWTKLSINTTLDSWKFWLRSLRSFWGRLFNTITSRFHNWAWKLNDLWGKYAGKIWDALIPSWVWSYGKGLSFATTPIKK